MTYTKEDILNMNPGQEMDELVADKVMGWPDHWKPFFPSTEIDSAFDVFDKFDIPTLKKWFDPDYNEWYTCVIGNHHISERTAPEAICKAALLVVYGAKEEGTE